MLSTALPEGKALEPSLAMWIKVWLMGIGLDFRGSQVGRIRNCYDSSLEWPYQVKLVSSKLERLPYFS